MKNYVFDEEEKKDGEEVTEEDLDSSEEDGFLEGFEDDDEEAEECSECGEVVKAEKKVTREIEGEKYIFCSKECADEFEESLGEQEDQFLFNSFSISFTLLQFSTSFFSAHPLLAESTPKG